VPSHASPSRERAKKGEQNKTKNEKKLNFAGSFWREDLARELANQGTGNRKEAYCSFYYDAHERRVKLWPNTVAAP